MGQAHSKDLQDVERLKAEVRRLSREGRYDEAIISAERLLTVRENALGPEHPDVALSLYNLANLYSDQDDNAKAKPLFQRALAIFEKALGPESHHVANSLNCLAILHSDQGDYAKAEPMFQRALAISEKARGPEHPDTADLLHNLAALHHDNGDYAKAEPLYQRALAIFEKAKGPEHPDVADSLMGLANLYCDTNDNVKAEPHYQRALVIREKALGTEHLDVAGSLYNLADLYSNQGDYANAEPLQRRALAIREKELGPEHHDVAISLHNLADIYSDQGDKAKAEPLYQRALAISEKTLGTEHPILAASLQNLAKLYYDQGDSAKAEPLYQRALAIEEKSLGTGHPEAAISFFNLGNLYHCEGDYLRAEPLYQRALTITEKTLGTEHPHIATFLNELAMLHVAKGAISQALIYQLRANEISERNIALNLRAGSERQQTAYLATLSAQADRTISLHVHYAPDDPTACNMAATIILQRKGRALDAMSDSLDALRSRFDEQDQALLDQLTDARAQIDRLIGAGPQNDADEQYQDRIMTLQDRAEILEAEISRRSAEIRAQYPPITLEAAQAAIPLNAALIEYASYRPFNAKDHVYGAPRYIAYIVRRHGEILWKELGAARAINASVAALRKALRDPKRKEAQRLSRAVDKKVLQPLRPLVGDGAELLISPDGAIKLIPFAELVDENGRSLMERFSFSNLISG
ncbi:MAG TPA: tetratricopeptide repeat protein, partial [Blastocatellia bacterium]|nr:tetratricopeptide repeat protein [Blastocatellia bacterium]